MTEFEIIKSYKEAKDKKAQIGILADLTLNSTREIREILAKSGVLEGEGEKPAKAGGKRAKSKSTVWTDEMVENLLSLDAEGVPMGEVAERLGVDAHAASNKLWAVKKASGRAVQNKEEGRGANVDEMCINEFERRLAAKTAECEVLRAKVEKLKLELLEKEDDERIECLRALAVLKGAQLFYGQGGSVDHDAIEHLIDVAADILEEWAK